MNDDPVAAVTWMMRGAWVTMAVRAACRLGILDLLTQPHTCADLARETATDPRALAQLLRVLVRLELLEARDDGAYAVTALGATLAQGHPSNLRSLALMQSWLPHIAAWNHLEDAVRTGRGVYEPVNGMEFWQHLSAHPDQLALFNQSMARRADRQSAAIADVDLTGVETVVDVGGGRGGMLAGILDAWPRLTGVLADRPDVVPEADAAFAARGLADRVHAVGCDFFVSVPGGADVYFLANVLHDWGDEDCRRILRTIRSAIDDHARLLILERVLGAPGRTDDQERDLAFVDLHMLVMFGAGERSQAEYDVLLEASGFGPSELAPTCTDWNVLEARPAG